MAVARARPEHRNTFYDSIQSFVLLCAGVAANANCVFLNSSLWPETKDVSIPTPIQLALLWMHNALNIRFEFYTSPSEIIGDHPSVASLPTAPAIFSRSNCFTTNISRTTSGIAASFKGLLLGCWRGKLICFFPWIWCLKRVKYCIKSTKWNSKNCRSYKRWKSRRMTWIMGLRAASSI